MLFGLIGKSLSHSFSQQYFREKFNKEMIDADYRLFEIPAVQEFLTLKNENPSLKGLNVTIPYKKEIIPFLDELSPEAKAIGAVNTVNFLSNGKTIGHNTDIYGFYESLLAFIPAPKQIEPLKALILGTGGASLAVEYVLKTYFQQWDYTFVSRHKKDNAFTYEELATKDLSNYQLIINTTPLGMYPHVDTCPNIPFEQLTEKHFVLDLVYNPQETLFMQKAKSHNAKVCNGLKMLFIQAEKAYEIWSK